MVRLELSARETEVLKDVLEGAVSDLRMEIADTDSKDYRERLKERKQALQRILAEVSGTKVSEV